MRWFPEHPKVSILIQTAKEQNILPRTPKIVIIELTTDDVTKINDAVRRNIEKRGGGSNVSILKNIGASEAHKSKNIGISPDTAGTLIPALSKRLKKEGYVHGIFEAIGQIYQENKLNKKLSKCNYTISLKSDLLEIYGKKYPVILGKQGNSPDRYTTGWCRSLIHEFLHIIEIENKKPILNKFSDIKQEAENIMGNYLPFEFWDKIEPM